MNVGFLERVGAPEAPLSPSATSGPPTPERVTPAEVAEYGQHAEDSDLPAARCRSYAKDWRGGGWRRARLP